MPKFVTPFLSSRQAYTMLQIITREPTRKKTFLRRIMSAKVQPIADKHQKIKISRFIYSSMGIPSLWNNISFEEPRWDCNFLCFSAFFAFSIDCSICISNWSGRSYSFCKYESVKNIATEKPNFPSLAIWYTGCRDFKRGYKIRNIFA